MRRVLPFLAVAALALALSSCSSVVGSEAPDVVRDEAGAVVTAGVVDPFSLRKGDCLLSPDGDRIADVELVPCGEVHDLEVFHVFDQPGEEYTSRNTLLAQAKAACDIEFPNTIGISYGASALEYRSIVPSEVSWRHGDRAIACAVFDPTAGPAAGTLFGAAR
ncbi:septum formation family protein [Rathayibacter sp. ZW T2_19]|uniref:Septum formation family protein n=1 Tax=Rathayibacter rubneri TaxID=2950106 RepID=A0A9X2DVT1_9MICO|nr:septum formation family protein [Rathayibacter rubneri]MCM6762107.1 septum formation family protein [Rathayibacter rubneri]